MEKAKIKWFSQDFSMHYWEGHSLRNNRMNNEGR